MGRSNAVTAAVRVEPGSADQRAAADIVSAVGPGTKALDLQLPDGRILRLTKGLVEALAAVADQLAEGHAVTVLRSDLTLTPAEAAALLGLSRPFVVRLLDDGAIPAERLPGSRHRRIQLADVLAFQATRERRRAGRQAIATAMEDAGIPY